MKTLVIGIVFVLSLLPGSTALAQQSATADQAERSGSGSAGTVDTVVVTPGAITAKPITIEHRFFDMKNTFAFTAVGASLAGDGWSTQRALALPGTREMNPLARPFVSSRGGEIAYSGASFAVVIGGMYLAHRTHHHKWERIAPFTLAGWESLLTAWNMHLGR